MDRSLAGYSPWGHRVRHDLVTEPAPQMNSYRKEVVNSLIILIMTLMSLERNILFAKGKNTLLPRPNI